MFVCYVNIQVSIPLALQHVLNSPDVYANTPHDIPLREEASELSYTRAGIQQFHTSK